MLVDKDEEWNVEINYILNFLQKEANKKGLGADTFENICVFKKNINDLYQFDYDGSSDAKVRLLSLQLNLSNSIIKYIFTTMKENNELLDKIWYLNWLIERKFIDIKIDTAIANINNEINNCTKKLMPN